MELAESVLLRVLLHGPDASSLRAALSASGRLDVVSAPDAPLHPAGAAVVVAAGDRTLAPDELEALTVHLRAGGGLVALGPALAAWCRSRAFAELAGWEPTELGPLTELRVRPEPGGALGPRLDRELLLRDRLPLGDPPADGAEVLATVPWRYTERTVAFRRRVGAGRLVYLGLGSSRSVYEEPAFRQLVYRSVLAAAGLDPAPPVGVGLYGYGAIGREHATSAAAVDGLELRAVCDRMPERRADAERRHGVPAHADAAALLDDPAVELVVVGVPPSLHATVALECLRAGKHVVCEKPFALRAADADRVMEAAARAGRAVAVYQSRRWDPDFVALRRAVRGGDIGRPFYAETFIGGFGHPCDYWHSHEPVSGGTVFDWGSHYFDWLLQLIPGRVVRVVGSAHKRVWHDVTNADQVRVDVTFEGGEQASFLQSEIAAAPKPKWYVLGTDGAAVGDWRMESVTARAWTGDLVEERLRPAEAPARVSVHRADGAGGVHVTELAQAPRSPHGFYRNLADHLLLGEPLAVPAAEARRNVAVLEAATRSVAEGGLPVEVRV
jgi:scyllo-inositol 2-dehydrogenase (NADP+)